jgi:flavin reductase (DIM6/NTAB) family NADH-FMN oxidoreductase RutF
VAEMNDKDAVGAALAMIPSGCAIMTCGAGQQATGMLASWVQQAAFEPPMVTVAVKQGRSIEPVLAASGKFVLNLLGEQPFDLFKHFGKGFAPGEPAFEGLATQECEFGVELERASAVLACTVSATAEAGDHQVVIGEVRAGRVVGGGKPYVHIRQNGFTY